MLKNINENTINKIGTLYLFLLIPGFILMAGSGFIFDDSKNRISILANILFWTTLLLPFTLV
jgi:hypothetical protein